MEQRDNSFSYTYSAEEQAEVQRIRNNYLPREESKMERLRALDRSVYQKAQAWSLSLGVVGALILGTGMSLIMSELGALLGILALPVGIGAGLVGLVLVALAYHSGRDVSAIFGELEDIWDEYGVFGKMDDE